VVDESSTAGPRPFKGFPRAVDESSAANPTNLNSMENEQAKGRPGGQARRAAILSFSALFAMHSPQPPDPHRLSINGSALKGLCHQLNIYF
jgi:hypothetical protein